MEDIAYIEESIELLPRISRLLSSAVAAHPEMGTLTITQGKAIALLYHQGDLRIGEIAAGLGISMPAASELVDRLETRRLVNSAPDPADRRRMVVELTSEALTFARRIHDLRREQVRAALGQMTPEEKPVFLKTLRVLASSLESRPAADSILTKDSR